MPRQIVLLQEHEIIEHGFAVIKYYILKSPATFMQKMLKGDAKSSLCPDKASKGQNDYAFTARLQNVRRLLEEPSRERLHEIVKDVSNIGTCKKWDHHFYDNEMQKVSNLFRVRPTTNGNRSILEVRSSTNSDTLSFCIKFNAENYSVNYASLFPVFRLMSKK